MKRPSLARRAVLLVLGVILLSGLFFFSDPINRFRVRVMWINLHTMGWDNGFWGLMKAPNNASPEELVRAYRNAYRISTPIAILESKEVCLNPSPRVYTITLVNGPHGRKLLVFEHYSDNWSVREEEP